MKGSGEFTLPILPVCLCFRHVILHAQRLFTRGLFWNCLFFILFFSNNHQCNYTKTISRLRRNQNHVKVDWISDWFRGWTVENNLQDLNSVFAEERFRCRLFGLERRGLLRSFWWLAVIIGRKIKGSRHDSWSCEVEGRELCCSFPENAHCAVQKWPWCGALKSRCWTRELWQWHLHNGLCRFWIWTCFFADGFHNFSFIPSGRSSYQTAFSLDAGKTQHTLIYPSPWSSSHSFWLLFLCFECPLVKKHLSTWKHRKSGDWCKKIWRLIDR